MEGNKGLGPAKLAQIMAALEIGRRFREDEALIVKQKIDSAQDVIEMILPQMRDLKTEVSKVVCLNSDNRIIDISDAASAQSITPAHYPGDLPFGPAKIRGGNYLHP